MKEKLLYLVLVLMMMMFYWRKASPKLRDDMTEVEYGGRGHRTRLRNDP